MYIHVFTDPCPEDGDFMDARPDAAKMEDAMDKFVNGLETGAIWLP